MSAFLLTVIMILLIVAGIVIIVLRRTRDLYRNNDGKTEEQREIERKARLFDEMMKNLGSGESE